MARGFCIFCMVDEGTSNTPQVTGQLRPNSRALSLSPPLSPSLSLFMSPFLHSLHITHQVQLGGTSPLGYFHVPSELSNHHDSNHGSPMQPPYEFSCLHPCFLTVHFPQTSQSHLIKMVVRSSTSYIYPLFQPLVVAHCKRNAIFTFLHASRHLLIPSVGLFLTSLGS